MPKQNILVKFLIFRQFQDLILKLSKMILRKIAHEILDQVDKIPVITLTGPRQSGKTTLARHLFPDYDYLNMELPEDRNYAREDPRGFLNTYSQGVIIDEVQHVPELFSYIQLHVDTHQENGKIILTGSQNFLLLEKISQSLAGRTLIFHLLPLSLSELAVSGENLDEVNTYMFRGFFPRLYKEGPDPVKWKSAYIQTYVERDVRQVIRLMDLAPFQLMLQLCAGRIGQLVNMNGLANEVGVDQTTIKRWLGILQAGFVIFLLQPHHQNFNKRLVKTPKLYFYDTGLACSLLQIQSEVQLRTHYARGHLFENLVLAEMMKYFYNQGLRPPLYFWRDHNGNEVDVILQYADKLYPLEIKAGQTLNPSFFKGLRFYQKLYGKETSSFLIYGGKQHRHQQRTWVVPWNRMEKEVFGRLE